MNAAQEGGGRRNPSPHDPARFVYTRRTYGAQPIRKYLQSVRKKQSAREIAEALERGGFHHQSKDFPNTVRAIMSRNAANEGDFVRLQTDWGLVAEEDAGREE